MAKKKKNENVKIYLQREFVCVNGILRQLCDYGSMQMCVTCVMAADAAAVVGLKANNNGPDRIAVFFGVFHSVQVKP